MSVPIGERRPSLIAAGDRLFGDLERPTLSIELPDGPGANIIFNRLASDWALVGVQAPARGKRRAPISGSSMRSHHRIRRRGICASSAAARLRYVMRKPTNCSMARGPLRWLRNALPCSRSGAADR
jgi:hypothetical protein